MIFFMNSSLLLVLLGFKETNMQIQLEKGVSVANICNCHNAIVFKSHYPNKHYMNVVNSSNIAKFSIRAIESIKKHLYIVFARH